MMSKSLRGVVVDGSGRGGELEELPETIDATRAHHRELPARRTAPEDESMSPARLPDDNKSIQHRGQHASTCNDHK